MIELDTSRVLVHVHDLERVHPTPSTTCPTHLKFSIPPLLQGSSSQPEPAADPAHCLTKPPRCTTPKHAEPIPPSTTSIRPIANCGSPTTHGTLKSESCSPLASSPPMPLCAWHPSCSCQVRQRQHGHALRHVAVCILRFRHAVDQLVLRLEHASHQLLRALRDLCGEQERLALRWRVHLLQICIDGVNQVHVECAVRLVNDQHLPGRRTQMPRRLLIVEMMCQRVRCGYQQFGC